MKALHLILTAFIFTSAAFFPPTINHGHSSGGVMQALSSSGTDHVPQSSAFSPADLPGTLYTGFQSPANETIHYGDLFVTGSETLLIEDSIYDQRGSVYIDGNATLLVRNATLLFTQSYPFQYGMHLAGTATLKISEYSHLSSNLEALLSSTDASQISSDRSTTSMLEWRLEGSSASILFMSSVPSLTLYHSAQVSANSSTITKVSVGGSAIYRLEQGSTHLLLVQDYSTVVAKGSLLNEIDLHFSGNTASFSLVPRSYTFWSFQQNVTSNAGYSVELYDSSVTGWSVHASSSSIEATESTLASLNLSATNASVTASTLTNLLVTESNVTVSGSVSADGVAMTTSSLLLRDASLLIRREITSDGSIISLVNSTLTRSLEVHAVDALQGVAANASIVVYRGSRLLSSFGANGSGIFSLDLPFASSAEVYRLVAYNASHVGVTDVEILYSRLVLIVVENDVSAPQILGVAPVDGLILRGPFEFSATAVDNVAVRRVIFYVDDLLLATMDDLRYSHTVDTSLMSEGGHTFKVVAFDFTGNHAQTSSSFSVDVAPPEIGNITYTPAVPTSSLSIVVSVEVSDAVSDLQSVVLSYNYVGDIFENVTMERVVGDRFESVIGPFFARQILLRVYASDYSGNVARSPTILVPIIIEVPTFLSVWSLLVLWVVSIAVFRARPFRRTRRIDSLSRL